MGYLQDLYEGDKEIAWANNHLQDDGKLIKELNEKGLYVVYERSAVYGRQTDAFLGTCTKVRGAFRKMDDIPQDWLAEIAHGGDSDYEMALASPPQPEEPEEPDTGFDYTPPESYIYPPCNDGNEEIPF